MDRTIIYYSSSRENPVFERKIQDTLLMSCGGLPIISVTQKPTDLGKNICVGDLGLSYLNEWKQILIGLKEATTDFCIAAESDCLYPEEYFTFTPPEKDKVYRYGNVWVHWKNKGFYKKYRCEGAQMCGREYWIERIEKMLASSTDEKKISREMFPEERFWSSDSPVLTFKTGNGVSQKTGYIQNSRISKMDYWDVSQYL